MKNSYLYGNTNIKEWATAQIMISYVMSLKRCYYSVLLTLIWGLLQPVPNQQISPLYLDCDIFSTVVVCLINRGTVFEMYFRKHHVVTTHLTYIYQIHFFTSGDKNKGKLT